MNVFSSLTGNRHRTLQRLVVVTIVAGALLVGPGGNSSAAALSPADWVGDSDLPSDPHDPGNGTREGKDLRVNYFPSGIPYGHIYFHAWDEKLDRETPDDAPNMFARINYYTRNGTKYEWNVDVPPGVNSSVQLGSDDDLKEGGDIYIKLCIDGTTDCSGFSHGIT